MPSETIPNGPVREAVLRSGISLAELARRMGYMRPDSTPLRRSLGLVAYVDVKRHRAAGRWTQPSITYEMAERICEAAGIDPVDVGC